MTAGGSSGEIKGELRIDVGPWQNRVICYSQDKDFEQHMTAMPSMLQAHEKTSRR
jgi:hypothetical protein